MKKFAFAVATAIALCTLTAHPASGAPDIEDPAFKYPYAAHAAGIELRSGIRSGLSLAWFVKTADTSPDNEITVVDRSPGRKWINLRRRDYKNITFLFAFAPASDANKGGLIGVRFIENSSPAQLEKVIARYMKTYPDLKRTRSTKDESRKVSQNGISFDIRDIAVRNKLESEKIEIIIENHDIGVSASGRRSRAELQFAANSMMLALRPQTAILVTITDKSLKQYLKNQRGASQTK